MINMLIFKAPLRLVVVVIDITTKLRNKVLFYLLFSLALSVGRSTGGIAAGVLIPTLVGCATVADLTEVGLPADVERTEGVCSTKFRPN